MLPKLIFFIFFIFQANIISILGIPSKAITYTLFSLGMLYWICKKKYYTTEGMILALWMAMMVFRCYTHIISESFQFSLYLILPALISCVLPDAIQTQKSLKLYKYVFSLFVGFFILEILIGTFEFVTKTHLLLWVDTTYGSEGLKVQDRPIGMAGAPLANSWIISCISMMVLYSPLKLKYKGYAYGICLFGLLVYQGRMGLLMSLIAFVFFIFNRARKMKFVYVVILFVSILCLFGIFFYLLICTSLGDRFLSKDDAGSSDMRFAAIEYFLNSGFHEFLSGSSYSDLQYLSEVMSVSIIECAIINQIVLYGLAFTIPFYGLYYFLLRRIVSNQSVWSVLFLYSLVFALNNTGIGWFSGYYTISMFYVSTKLLNHKNLPYLIPHKYIETK